MVRFFYILLFVLTSFASINAQDYIVKSLPVDGFCPVVFQDTIYFCKLQQSNNGKIIKDNSSVGTSNIYAFNYTDTSISINQNFPYNTALNEGPISFNSNYKIACFTRNNETSKPRKLEKNQNPLGLYFIPFSRTNQTQPLPFEHNSMLYNNCHPSFVENTSYLIFASDMPGGFGGFDLYVSTFNGSGWDQPVNLGETVNSEKNELFPSIKNGVLYFSRDDETGQLDIYQVLFQQNIASEKLPFPFNSEKDDFGISFSNDNQTIYISSNRNGTDSIYQITPFIPSFENHYHFEEFDLCYTISEPFSAAMDSLNGLIYEWKIDNQTIVGSKFEYCFKGEGVYPIALNIIDTIVDVTYENEAIFELDLTHPNVPYFNLSDTISKNNFHLLEVFYTNNTHPISSKTYWYINDTYMGTGDAFNLILDTPGTYKVGVGTIGTINDTTYNAFSFRNVVVKE